MARRDRKTDEQRREDAVASAAEVDTKLAEAIKRISESYSGLYASPGPLQSGGIVFGSSSWHQYNPLRSSTFGPTLGLNPAGDKIELREGEVTHSTKVIVGYRVWPLSRSYPDGYRLNAANAHFGGRVEPYEKLTAECKTAAAATLYMGYSPFPTWGELEPQPKHEAPGRDCQCGIYAYKRTVPLEDSEKPYVCGEVNLWGRIIEHADGYRAQFAYPKRLVVVDGGANASRIAVALELTYGVPCEVWQG